MTSQTTVEKAPQGQGGVREPVPGPAKGLRGHPWLTLFGVAVGVMMVALDGTIVAIANPAIQADLGASLDQLQWITNGYLLALAVALITAGKLGDRFGHRQTFLIGIAGFALASGAIGLSDSIGAVITFRVLQGVFGALLIAGGARPAARHLPRREAEHGHRYLGHGHRRLDGRMARSSAASSSSTSAGSPSSSSTCRWACSRSCSAW